MDTREPSCHLPWPTEALPHKFLRGWRLHYCCPLDPGKGVTSGVSRETDSTWLLWTKIQAIQTTCKNCPPALIRIAQFSEAQVFCQYCGCHWDGAELLRNPHSRGSGAQWDWDEHLTRTEDTSARTASLARAISTKVMARAEQGHGEGPFLWPRTVESRGWVENTGKASDTVSLWLPRLFSE